MKTIGQYRPYWKELGRFAMKLGDFKQLLSVMTTYARPSHFQQIRKPLNSGFSTSPWKGCPFSQAQILWRADFYSDGDGGINGTGATKSIFRPRQ
jgi:hypothetical protein